MKLFIAQTLILALSSVVYGVEERIEFDSSTGNYVIWEDVNGVLEPATFVPATKVKPYVMTKVHAKDAALKYRYIIRNSKDSEQPIETIIVNASGIDDVVLNSTEWKTDELMLSGHSSTKAGLAYWGESDGGIAPGNTLSFLIGSHNLAGIGYINFQGATPLLKFKGYGVDPEIQADLDALMEPDKNSVLQYVVAPAIEITAEFNVTDVLRKMIVHAETLEARGVIDSVYVQTLARHLQAAIDAELNGNKPGVWHNLGLATAHLSSHKHEHDRENKDNPGEDERVTVRGLLAKAYLFDIGYIHSQMHVDHHEESLPTSTM